jgi:carbamoylphosphate synthase large subunit
VLGSGPNRIGQGIEFDYCCVHGVLAIKEVGYEAIMVNCNPETVHRLRHRRQTLLRTGVLGASGGNTGTRKPDGVIVQLGGQTALKLAEDLQKRLEHHRHSVSTAWTSPKTGVVFPTYCMSWIFLTPNLASRTT